MLKFSNPFSDNTDSIKSFVYNWIKGHNSGYKGPICLPNKQQIGNPLFAEKVYDYFEQMEKDGLLSKAKAGNYCLTEKGFNEIYK